jgi:Bacterial type II and III secretion system protein
VTNNLRKLGLVVMVVLALGTVAGAQEPAKALAVTPVRVQVVVSKYQGEKKTSSLPYTMSINVGPALQTVYRASVRIGAQVPIMTTAKAGDPPSVQYRDVGTQIDCNANLLDDGRFKLEISIDDSSVYSDTGTPQSVAAHLSDRPAFRSFRSSDSVLLKDGQTVQYTAATDKVSGETVKVDVTLTVVK